MPTLMIHHTNRDTFTASVYFGVPSSHAEIGRVHAREISEEDAKRPLEDLLSDWMVATFGKDKVGPP
jgi:hypothetical protein